MIHRHGFSLLELSVVLTIIAIVIAGGLTLGSAKTEQNNLTGTYDELQEINNAIAVFVNEHGCLPYPADETALPGTATYGREPAANAECATTGGTGTTILAGDIPFYSLGLPDEYGGDHWLRRYTYAVTDTATETGFDNTFTGGITVNDDGGSAIASDVVYVLISHGKTQKGAYTVKGGTVAAACDGSDKDGENCDADDTFVDGNYNDGEIAANFFDDILVWKDAVGIFEYGSTGVSIDPTNTIAANTDIVAASAGIVTAWGTEGAGGGVCGFSGLVDGVQIAGDQSRSASGSTTHISFPVPNGSTYRVNMDSDCNGSEIIRFWPFMSASGSSSSSTVALGFCSISPMSLSTCDIGTDGKAYCWGAGYDGELGQGATTSSPLPAEVGVGEGPGTYVQMQARSRHACAVGTNGKAYCWGDGDAGRLGDAGTADQGAPREVHTGESPGTFTMVTAGNQHSCGIGTDSKGYCWGDGINGRLGNGATADQGEPVEVHAGESPGTFTRMIAGDDHNCGIGTDSKAYCWGEGTNGRLGNGATSDEDEPVEVHAGAGTGSFVQVSAGSDHSCGISTDGKAYCWGEGTDGKLGNGATSDQTEPVEVSAGESPGTFTQVFAGAEHSCGVGTDGKAYCWGNNANGRLGNNSTTTSNLPVEVHAGESLGTFVQVFAGGNDHTCAIGTDDKAYCWGDGADRRLGNNSTSDEHEPIEVLTGAGYSTIGCN